MEEISFSEKIVILDSCILQYLDDKKFYSQIIGILENLIAKDNKLALSEFSRFELLRGATLAVEKRMEALINEFKLYEVSKNILSMAARLDTLYRGAEVHSGMSDGDKILASTAVLANGLVFTGNFKDFPAPFFKTVTRKILYKDSAKHQPLIVGILEPDLPIIGAKMDGRK